MIRALAADIDGTLTDQNRVLCPVAVETIRKLNAPIVLSTGNTHCFSRTVSILLGTPRIFIAENGGVISHAEDDMEILADQQICNDAYHKLANDFALHKFETAGHRYRFTDVTLQRDFDASAVAARVRELGLPVDIVDTVFAVHIKDNCTFQVSYIGSAEGHEYPDLQVGDEVNPRPFFVLS